MKDQLKIINIESTVKKFGMTLTLSNNLTRSLYGYGAGS